MSGRIHEHAKERVREASDLVEIVAQYAPLKKAGSSFKARCPFHEEKTPSFNVNPGRQLFHCFGCHVGGDVFDFIMLAERMTFPEALRYLADRAGVALPEYDEPRAETDIGRDALLRVNARFAAWAQDILFKQPTGEPGRAYLQSRGITSDVAKAFGLGYAPAGWTNIAQAAPLRELPRPHLQAAGLVRPRDDGSVYDHFRNRVVFPIHGPGGDIVAFGGRTIGDDPAKYINSPETPVYKKGTQLYNLHRARREIQRVGYAILVEGYLDAIRLDAAGLGAVVATCGTALTPQQAKLLARYADRVALAYDGDAAGRAAAEKAAGLLLEADLDVRMVAAPDGQDPDSFVREHGAEAFQALLDEAPDIVDFVLREAPVGHAMTIEQRVRFADRLTPLLERIPHRVRRHEYLRKLTHAAARLNLDMSLLAGNGPDKALADAASPAAPARAGFPLLRERDRELLRYVLGQMPGVPEPGTLDVMCEEASPVAQRILRHIQAAAPPYASDRALLDATEDAEERRVLTALLSEATDEERRYRPEWLFHHIDLRTLNKRVAKARTDLAAAEAEGDASRVASLMEEVQTLLAERARKKHDLHTVVEVEP